jgi:hypothetical protein
VDDVSGFVLLLLLHMSERWCLMGFRQSRQSVRVGTSASPLSSSQQVCLRLLSHDFRLLLYSDFFGIHSANGRVVAATNCPCRTLRVDFVEQHSQDCPDRALQPAVHSGAAVLLVQAY